MKYLMKAKEIATSANDSKLSDSELLNLDKYLNSLPGNMSVNTASRTEPDQESVVSESTIGMMSTPGIGSTIGTHSTSLLSSSSSAMH